MLVLLLRRGIGRRPFSTTTTTTTTTTILPTSGHTGSKLYNKYSFTPPPSLDKKPNTKTQHTKKKKKPLYRPPSSLDMLGKKPLKPNLPFDFQFSYTESSLDVRPIGLREPKYSPFGPGRVDRVWTGVAAPAVDPLKGKEETEKLEAERKKLRDMIQGEELTDAERRELLHRYGKATTKRQINLGRDGLTHNMLNDIHNAWKYAEAIRIKCMGVPTVDMNNVCTQLEDKTSGKIIYRKAGTLMLYRGRNYNPKKRPVIPLMLWKPHEPIYPRLIKSTIQGLSSEETKKLRERGLAAPALKKLAKNGFYGHLVTMIRDAFLVLELVRIDCEGLDKSDYKKLGAKLKVLVPCILLSFANEQIVIWRGKDYKPKENSYFLTESESVDKSDTSSGDVSQDVNHGQDVIDSDDEK